MLRLEGKVALIAGAASGIGGLGTLAAPGQD
jgi:NAD(P)-dependent dehydrogenase (short-subunit alcohol dehydrogenase family)